MEKQIFPLPAAVWGRQMSACAASTLDCAALGTTTWPFLLSHRVWAAVTLPNFSLGWALGTVGCWGGASMRSGSSTCTRVHQHLLHPLLVFTQETHKRNIGLVCFDKNSCVSGARWEEKQLTWIRRRGKKTSVALRLSPTLTRKSQLETSTLKPVPFKECVASKTYSPHVFMCVRHYTNC